MTSGLHPKLAEILEPEEQVLWWGRPHYPYFRSEAWASFVFGFIPLVASAGASVFTIFLVYDALNTWVLSKLVNLPIVLIPAIGFGYVAAEALAVPWQTTRRLKQAFYAITDRRAIVYHSVGYALSATAPVTNEVFYAFPIDQVRARTIQKRHGKRIDILLGTEMQPGG